MTTEATPKSRSADLSRLDAEFGQGPSSLAGLTSLAPKVTLEARVENGWLHLRGAGRIGGWYSDRSGPMLYQNVTGDFLVETRVQSVLAADFSKRPTASFNSAGLVMRDPLSRDENMRWVMYNIGQQDGFYGREAKTTRPYAGRWHQQQLAGFKSLSTFILTKMPDGLVEATIRMCRIGPEIRMYHRYPGETRWSEETQDASTTIQGNGSSEPTPGVVPGGVIRMARPDLPETLQVGVISNPGMSPNDGLSRFSYLRFRRIDDFSECQK
jgi:hypothetical protein